MSLIKIEHKLYDLIPISTKEPNNISLIYKFYKNNIITSAIKEKNLLLNSNINKKYEDRKHELNLIQFQLFFILFFCIFLIGDANNMKGNLKYLIIFFLYIILLNYIRGIVLLFFFLNFLIFLQCLLIALLIYGFSSLHKFNFMSLEQLINLNIRKKTHIFLISSLVAIWGLLFSSSFLKKNN
jgi:hypothetical protein